MELNITQKANFYIHQKYRKILDSRYVHDGIILYYCQAHHYVKANSSDAPYELSNILNQYSE